MSDAICSPPEYPLMVSNRDLSLGCLIFTAPPFFVDEGVTDHGGSGQFQVQRSLSYSYRLPLRINSKEDRWDSACCFLSEMPVGKSCLFGYACRQI